MTERRHGRQRHIEEGEAHVRPFAGAQPMPLGGEHGERAGLPTDEVPRRQHVVDRLVVLDRAGHERKADRCIHRVVQGGRAITVARDREHVEVVPMGAQRVVGHPAAGREVREEVAGRRNQLRQEFLCGWVPQIDGHGSLVLVQAGPVERIAVGRERPALVIDAAADLIEPDDIGAKLGEGHAA